MTFLPIFHSFIHFRPFTKVIFTKFNPIIHVIFLSQITSYEATGMIVEIDWSQVIYMIFILLLFFEFLQVDTI